MLPELRNCPIHGEHPVERVKSNRDGSRRVSITCKHPFCKFKLRTNRNGNPSEALLDCRKEWNQRVDDYWIRWVKS